MGAMNDLAAAVGRVQVSDVGVEDSLRVLWLEMTGKGIVEHLTPRRFGVLLDQCKRLLPHVSMPDDLRPIAEDVLLESTKAHDLRNVLVHDVWVHDREHDVWRSGNAARRKVAGTDTRPRDVIHDLPGRPIEDFQECVRRLLRLQWRINALVELLRNPHKDEEDRWFDHTLASGNFEMSEDGSAVTLIG